MNDKYLAELREQIRFIASDFRPNEFEPEKPIQHCRLNRKKVDQIMEAVVAALAKQDRESRAILESDIAYAIGHGIGCGHRLEYLEKRYPHLTTGRQKRLTKEPAPEEEKR